MTKRNGGNWTEGRYRTFVRSALRAAFRKWPPKFEVLKNARTTKRINHKTGRLAMHYICAQCATESPLSSVQVDHIKPVVDVKKGFVNWDTFIERLFCEKKGLQVLCQTCHKMKSKMEHTSRHSKSAKK